MTEQNYENNQDLQPPSRQSSAGEELDAAGRSFSEALRISFVILKIIMIVLVIIFLASGFRTVDTNEQALVLRFGKIQRILGPGPHLVFPYPIDEVVKIRVLEGVSLPINSFWYFQTEAEKLGPRLKTRKPPQKLDPLTEGYCITQGEKETQTIVGSAGSDYNIVHSKWQLTYWIKDPELFFKNIYVEDVKPGQSYFDVITKSIEPLLKAMFEDAVVTAMVHYTIVEVLESPDMVRDHIERLLQKKLAQEVESGIVVSVDLTKVTWPRQVNDAFLASIEADQESETAKREAKTYRGKTLSEAEGLTAEKLAQARAYRTKVVETAKANAEYLHKILPEYRKRPELVIRKIYQDTIEEVLNNVDETFIIQPTGGNAQFWILVSRNPKIKPKSTQ